MNKILIGVNAILIAAVAFLFFKVNSLSGAATAPAAEDKVETPAPKKEPVAALKQLGNTPTGKIAYVNIDELNENSLEINDMINEAKKRRNNIEGSLENLNMQYQKKMEDYQNSAKAGIASQNEMQMKEKEKEIMAIEKEAQNKQLQMENLTMDISEKNTAFQKNVKSYLLKWNDGKYDFILSYSDAVPSMLLGNTSLEITKEIIEALNAEYKQRHAKK